MEGYPNQQVGCLSSQKPLCCLAHWVILEWYIGKPVYSNLSKFFEKQVLFFKLQDNMKLSKNKKVMVTVTVYSTNIHFGIYYL